MLTPNQAAFFQDQGYLITPGFFSQREVNAMRLETARLKREGLGCNVATEGDGKTESKSSVNYQIIPLNDKSDLFRALPFSSKVLNAIGRLIGEPFVRHLDQMFIKPGRSGIGTNWHQDNAYFKIANPSKGTGMWIALHDAHLENGTLHVIPKSHLNQDEHERDPESNHHIRMNADESRAVPAILSAGGVVFFNYGIAHSTKQNNTDQERTGLAYHFVRTDHAHLDPKKTKKDVHLTGPIASGGENEYGIKVAGTWEKEVERVVEGELDNV